MVSSPGVLCFESGPAAGKGTVGSERGSERRSERVTFETSWIGRLKNCFFFHAVFFSGLFIPLIYIYIFFFFNVIFFFVSGCG